MAVSVAVKIFMVVQGPNSSALAAIACNQAGLQIASAAAVAALLFSLCAGVKKNHVRERSKQIGTCPQLTKPANAYP